MIKIRPKTQKQEFEIDLKQIFWRGDVNTLEIIFSVNVFGGQTIEHRIAKQYDGDALKRFLLNRPEIKEILEFDGEFDLVEESEGV